MQSLGLTEVAYQNALIYAKDRLQVSSMRRTSGWTMMDQPFVGCLRPGKAAHLQAVFCVDQCILVRDFSQAERLHADAEARGIHHHEHRVQALVRLADQPKPLAPSIFIWHVELPCMPIFSSIAPQKIGLRTPGVPSAFG